MRNGKVYDKFVLTVYVFDFVQFCSCLPIHIQYTIHITKNIILSCLIFAKVHNEKKSELFL